MELKQAIIVRKDLKMPKGKLAVQVAHGSVQAVLNSDKKIVEAWSKQGMKKVVLKIDSEKELRQILKDAKNEGLACGLINDAGRTFLAPGTTTVLGIGPDTEEKIDSVVGTLKLL